MRPYKIEKGFGACNDDHERSLFGQKLVSEYTKKLKKGWVPWHDPESIYEDEINYHDENKRYSKLRKSSNTIRRLMSDHLAMRKMSLKQKSFRSYQSKLRIFNAFLEKKNYHEYHVTAIDNKIIVDFFSYLIKDAALDYITVKNYKIALSLFFTDMIKQGHIRESPVVNVPMGQKIKDEAPRPMIPSDLDAFLNHVRERDPQLYLACLVQYFCAIRPGTELRLMKVKDINFFMKMITITSVNAKTTTTRTVNIPVQLFELMTRCYNIQTCNKEYYVFGNKGVPGEKPTGINSFRKRFCRYRDELGMSKDYKFYSMKHTGACFLIETGAFSIKDLQRHIGHRDINSTNRYIEHLGGNLTEKIRYNFPDPFSGFSDNF
ncbi:MAG: site-specific integrase [Odoribacteraceae bacterium]|jgi:integrase|nr:site-specific integrase [Odoribacteraceae bacterium]